MKELYRIAELSKEQRLEADRAKQSARDSEEQLYKMKKIYEDSDRLIKDL